MAKVPSQMTLTPSVLDRLLDDDPRAGAIDFDAIDFQNLAKWAKTLRDATDPLSTYLHERLSNSTKTELSRFEEGLPIPIVLEESLVDDLNTIIGKYALYDKKRFKHVSLSKETSRLVEQSAPGIISPSLNRSLMEEAYPEQLIRRRRDLTSYNISQLKNDVSRDLAALLNTRKELVEDPGPEYKEVKSSVVNYGLPDFTSLSLVSPSDRKLMRRSVEQAIAMFEPRLKSVRVALEAPKKFDQVLRFRIEALLRVEPSPEPVRFDAVLHMATQEYAVQG